MAKPIKVSILGDASSLIGSLKGAATALTGFSTKAASAGKIGAVAVAAGIGLAAVKFIGMGAEMVQQLDDFKLATGLTGDAAQDAFDSMLGAAKQLPDAIEDVVVAGGNLITATGLLGDEAEALTVQFMDLNRLGFGALTENQVGEFMHVNALSADELAESLDFMAQVAQATGVPIELMTEMATSSAAALDLLGLSTTDGISFLGDFENAGIDTNKMLRTLQAEIDLAGSTGEDTSGIMASLTGVMDDGAISAEETALLYRFFGQEAADIIPQLEAGTLSLADQTGQLGLTGQSIQDMTDESATMGEKFSELKNKVLVELAPAMMKLGDVLIEVVDWVFVNLPPAAQAFKDFADKVIGHAKDIWTLVGPYITAIVELFKTSFEMVQALWDTFSALFRGDWSGFWDGIKQVVKTFWKLLKGVFKVQLESLKLQFKVALTILKATVFTLFTKVKDTMVSLVKSGVQSVVDLIVGLPARLLGLVGKVAGAAGDIGKAMGKGLLNGIVDAASGAAGLVGDIAAGLGNALVNAMNNIIGKVNRAIPNYIDLPWPAGSIDLPNNPIPSIPGFQHGGTLGAGVSMVGERGPELISMGAGGASVQSNRESGLGGAGGGVTVNVQGSNASPEEIAAAVVWKMRRS